MHSFAVHAYEAENIHGYAHTLSPASVVGQWKVEQNIADGIVYISQNGGAWTPLAGGGGVANLQDAYDGGYTAGYSITIAPDTPISIINTAAVSSSPIMTIDDIQATGSPNSILTLTRYATPDLGVVNLSPVLNVTNAPTVDNDYTEQSPGLLTLLHSPVAGLGTLTDTTTLMQVVAASPDATAQLTGVKIDFSNGTATQILKPLVVIGAPTTVAKVTTPSASRYGVITVQNRAQNTPSMTYTFRNKSAVGGSIVSLGWDDTNFEGAVASSILTGTTHMFTLDGTTNVDAATNNVEFVGMMMYVPATTSPSTYGTFINSRQLAGSVVRVDVAAAGVIAATGVNGITSVMNSSANPNGSAFFARWLNAEGASKGIARFSLSGGIITTSSERILQLDSFSGTHTLGASLHGIYADLATNITPGAQAVVGAAIYIPASTSGSTFGVNVQTAQKAGIGYVLDFSGATTLTGQFTGLYMDMLTRINSTAEIIQGATIMVGQTSSASSYALGVTSYQTGSASAVVNVAMSPAAAGNVNGIYVVGNQNVTTIDHATGYLFYGNQGANGRGINATTGTSYSGSFVGGNMLWIARSGAWSGGGTETAGNMFAQIAWEPTISANSTILSQQFGVTQTYTTSAGTTTASNDCVLIQRTPTRSGGTLNISGSLLKLQHAPVGTIGTDTSSLLVGTTIAKSGTTASLTSTATLTGALTMLSLSASGVTAASNGITGAAVTLPANGSTGAVAHYGYSVTRSGTLGTGTNNTGILVIAQNTPARAAGAATENGILFYAVHAPTTGGGGALTDTTTGLYVGMTPFSSSAVIGSKIVMGANTSATGIGSDVSWRSLAGGSLGAARINTSVAGTSTSAHTHLLINSLTAYTLGAALTGINVDLMSTATGAVTPGAQACIGVRITIPATTRSNVTTEGALYIDSSATAAHSIMCLAKNTSGNVAQIKHNSGVTAVGTIIGLKIDTSVTANGNTVTGIYVTGFGTTAAAAAWSGSVVIDSWNTKQAALYIAAQNLQDSIVTIAYPGETTYTLSNTLYGIAMDLTTHISAGAIAVIGHQVLIPDSTSANSRGLLVTSTQKGASWGLELAMTPGASAAVGGALITLGANATGAGLSVVQNGTGATRGAVVTSAQTGGQLLTITGTGTLASAMIGANIDLSGQTAGGQVVYGAAIATPTGAGSTSLGLSITCNTTGMHQMQFALPTDGTYHHILGPATGQLRMGAGTAAQVAATTAGRDVSINASSAVAGSSSAGAAAGGSIYLNAGNAARLTSGNADGGSVEVDVGTGIGTGVPGGFKISPNVPTYAELYEMTAPAVAATNGARLFAVDNGAGKTVLKVQFQSGAAQTIATEP